MEGRESCYSFVLSWTPHEKKLHVTIKTPIRTKLTIEDEE
jgi:hypothetical protein